MQDMQCISYSTHAHKHACLKTDSCNSIKTFDLSNEKKHFDFFGVLMPKEVTEINYLNLLVSMWLINITNEISLKLPKFNDFGS